RPRGQRRRADPAAAGAGAAPRLRSVVRARPAPPWPHRGAARAQPVGAGPGHDIGPVTVGDPPQWSFSCWRYRNARPIRYSPRMPDLPNVVTWSIPAFVLLTLLEAVSFRLPPDKDEVGYGGKDTATSLSMGLGSLAFDALWGIVPGAVYAA